MCCATILHDWKKYLTFHNTNNFKNGKNYSCAASIFNETQFLEVNTASLSTQKKERKKKIEFEQSSWGHKIQWIKRMCVNW